MANTLSRKIGNQTMVFESGKLARQAEGSVVVTYGETQVLGTCTTADPREGIDFFPLRSTSRSDVRGRKITAASSREGPPVETAMLTARLHRPLRPSFRTARRGPGRHHRPVGRHGEPVRHPGMNAEPRDVLAGLR
jgi:polyribonucleotide nucleotidyltransferase